MKIAVVVNTSWNIYNFRRGLIRSLRNEGHQVFAVAPQDKFSSLLSSEGFEFIKVNMDSRGANIFKDFGLVLELFNIYRRIKPDVILQFTIKPNIYGTFSAWMLGIPVINNVCGLGTVFLNKGIVSIIALTLYKIAFRFPRKIFFQNPDDLNLFLLKKLVEASATDLVPGSGIDLKYFAPDEKPKQDRQFTFLMISRIIHDKGVAEFVEAARLMKLQFPAVQFQLLGAIDEKHKRGISRVMVQSWIDSGLVKYLEPAEDVRPAIASSDCVVLPSYREGTPRTLLEAAGMAKPLIATNVPGCRQLINHGENGFLCRLKDAPDLAMQMEKMLLLTSEQRNEMGVKSRKMVEKEYDERLVIDKYLRSIAEINPALV